MGYYFINNLQDFERAYLDRSQVLWVGDHAFEIYQNLKSNELIKEDQNFKHQLITFGKDKSLTRIEELTVLSETVPLWEEHYTLSDLINAFVVLEDEYIKSSENELIIIGNPGELITQGVINFLLDDKRKNLGQVQVVLLKDKAMYLAFHDEISKLGSILDKYGIYTIETEGENFDWIAYFNMQRELIKKKKFQRQFHNHS